MRAKIGGIEIEGTPEEIAKFAELHTASYSDRSDVATKRREDAVSDDAADQDGITEGFAYRTLRRLPLSAAQKALLRALRDSSPDWMLSSEIQKALDCSPTSLGGIFGGLGRRVSATSGYESGFNLWDYKWDDDEGEWTYRLPQNVLKALDRAGL